MKFYTVFGTVLPQLLHLHPGKFVLNCLILINSGNVMIWCSNCPFRIQYLNASFFKIKKSNRTGHFMDNMLIDEEYIRTVWDYFYHMVVPDFIEFCFLFHLFKLYYLLPIGFVGSLFSASTNAIADAMTISVSEANP